MTSLSACECGHPKSLHNSVGECPYRRGHFTEPHPETVCRRCGGPNVSWFAPSPLWNAVMRGGSINGPQEFDELICPTCFAVLAEERGIAEGWRLTATTVHAELETTTPSGRVWKTATDMWEERS